MKVVSYLATLPRKDEYTAQSLQRATDKSNTLRYVVQGAIAAGDQGIIWEQPSVIDADVAMILGWVHEHGKTAAHLQLRQQIVDHQRERGARTLIADSNLFLYKNTNNPGYWLRYSFDGVFPNTGEYCDSAPDPQRWINIQKELGVTLKPWRTQGDHILMCLQRDGGWSMAGWDVVDWALRTIQILRRHTRRPIRIRAHPGDKRARKYSDRLIKLCTGRQLGPVSLSTPGSSLENDFANCWAVVNHNSSPAVAAAIEGIPVFVTDADRSQARDVANRDLAKIENPNMPDRLPWVQRISQFHWSHQEIQDGTAWRHMRQWVKV
jgi:hypothetical protein